MPALELFGPGSGEREKVVSQLMEQIKLVSAPASANVYDISYRGTTPQRAEQLVAATLDLFVSTGLNAKKRDSEDAGRFIEKQIRAYEGKLVEAENRLKNFKTRNFGVSGVSDKDYFARVSALSEGADRLRIELASAERSRDAYRRELAIEDPQLPAPPMPRVGAVTEVETRLEATKKQLDELLGRYTEAHPDVVSTRRIVAQLEEEAKARRAADDRALALSARNAKPGTAATSPVYQRLRISLAETEAKVAALRSQLASQQGQLQEMRALAGRAPQVEAELAQMNRDYDIIRKNYDQMVARRESASLGVKLDESAQLAEFRVVEPPRASPRPVLPARWHLALAALFVSRAAGVAAAMVADVVRPTFDEAKSLHQFSGRTVLGTVSMRPSVVALRGRQSQRLRFTVAVALLVVLQMVWVAWIAWKPTLG
jgi:polysaccharide chain length determinant protein (PEP-CTERM system associated)